MRSTQRQSRDRDTTLAELLALPVVMASLSLLMWFSLPTLPEALNALGSRFDERRETLKRLAPRAANLLPARSSRCATAVDPVPRFVEREQDTDSTTNMEILGSPRLRELGIDVVIPDELNLNLSGDLSMLMLWRMSPFVNSRRMTRQRIAHELERPLSYRYVLFFGDEMTEALSRQADGRPRGAVRVSGVLFDLNDERQLCELSFEERISPQFRDEADFDRLAYSQLWSQARERLLSELASIARGS